MKYYFISAEIEEGYPDYDFVLKALCLDDAIKEAKKILKKDYPETFNGYSDRFDAQMVTGEKLLSLMTIN